MAIPDTLPGLFSVTGRTSTRKDQEMQSQEIIGRLQFVARFSLYIAPSGELIIISGNQRVGVTPDQAHELLDHTVNLARIIHVTEAVASLNGSKM